MEEPADPRGTKGPLNTRPFCISRSETVVERMLSNWMSICLYQYLKVGSTQPCQGAGRDEVVLYPPNVHLPAAQLHLDGFASHPGTISPTVAQPPRVAVGQRRGAAVQALQGHQASGGEGAGGCCAEESQIHPQRHRAAGGRRGVCTPGEPLGLGGLLGDLRGRVPGQPQDQKLMPLASFVDLH